MQQLRGRRRRSEAFLDLERCSQDAPGSLDDPEKNPGELACGDSQCRALRLISSEATGVPVAPPTKLQLSPLSGDVDAPTVHAEEILQKKRVGLALPRNPLEVCKKMGFVVTRKNRTLSLDDFSGNSQSASLVLAHHHRSSSQITTMRLFSSKDDTCLPLVSDCSLTELKKGLILTAHKNVDEVSVPLKEPVEEEDKEADSRCYNLVGSPGPKLLLRASSQREQGASGRHEEEDSLRCTAMVPFKWEEAPGKPKQEAIITTGSGSQESHCLEVITLQLPPRLLAGSLTTSRSTRKKNQLRARSVNRGQGVLLADRPTGGIPRGATGEKGAVTNGPDSPTSILSGPEINSMASSSDTTSDSALDSEVVAVSDAESGVQQLVSSCSSQCGDSKGNSTEEKRRSFAARILHPEWLAIRRRSVRKYRGSGEAEISECGSEDCFKLDLEGETVSLQSSGQLVGYYPEAEKTLDALEKSTETCVSSNEEEIPDRVDSLGGGEIMYCGCTSPRIGPFSPSSRLRFLRSNSEKQKRWMVKRIRRSSRLFQMFFMKAIKQAVQPRRRHRSSKIRFSQ